MKTHYDISPSTLSGHLIVPPSKSHSLRAILFASLARGRSVINNVLASPDIAAMISACGKLGAVITVDDATVIIEGVDGKPTVPDDVIDAGNSGQVLRFIGAIAGLVDGYTVITGDESVRYNRPIAPLRSALKALGATCFTTKKDDYAPLVVGGPMSAGQARMDGADSQPVSAMLMAACFLEGDTVLEVENAGELPWVGLTLDWFDRLGLTVENDNFSHYRISGGQSISGFEYTVPSDFSSLAYPLVAAVITGSSLCLGEVDMQDPQGDKAIVAILQEMGASIHTDESARTLNVARADKPLRACVIDCNPCIDAVPILAVAACFATGQTQLTGAAIARKKESNRLTAMTTELTKMGAIIEETADGLLITGASLRGATCESHHDHRIAMACAVAALGAETASVVSETTCIQKSYPNFLQQFQQLGANMQ